jgi:hypothetical protein
MSLVRHNPDNSAVFSFESKGRKATISLPEKAPDNIASVIAVEIDGEPK